MIYFHVQRLSGGFVLTVLVGIVGMVIFIVKTSVGTGFVFLGYIIVLATYLNVLGMIPPAILSKRVANGRQVLWQPCIIVGAP